MTSTITVMVSGPVGCGKSAIAGEIEIALRAIGIPVRYADPIAAQSEKNMTHADWQTYLQMYEPKVVLVVETLSSADKGRALGGTAVSTLGINEIKHKCCGTFAQAQTSGTDNEGYGPLLYPIGHNVYAGTDLLPFACCPWCGKEIEEPPS